MKEIISASRRTDIPAYYLDRLKSYIKQGYAEVHHPYSGKVNIVSLRREDVHTLVLWSKNFRNFLKNSTYFNGYNLYFLFTINNMPDFEPGIPNLDERIQQLHELAEQYSPQRIAWRFDPVIFRSNGPVMNIGMFERIGKRVAAAGVTRTIFSFLDIYGKVRKRNKEFRLHLIDPTHDIKNEYAIKLAKAAEGLGLTLESCSEELEGIEGISPSSCINGNLLSQLSGEPARRMKDPGQRKACNCTVSRDIGSYQTMPCPNGCLYCYANPHIEVSDRRLLCEKL